MSERTVITRDIEAAPNGWRYTVPDTGVTLTAKWASSLKDKVIKHMAANDIEVPPDFDEIFADATCRESELGPPYCGQDHTVKPSGVVEFLTWGHVGRFLRAAAVWLANPLAHVSREEADRRFDICMECPMRVDLGDCVKCYALSAVIKTTEAAVSLTLGRKIEDGKRTCGACGCYVEGKVVLKIPVLRKLDKKLDVVPAYDTKCWMHDAP